MGWGKRAKKYIAERQFGSMPGILNLISLFVGVSGILLSGLSYGGMQDSILFVSAYVVVPIVLIAWIGWREFDLARRQRYSDVTECIKRCARTLQEVGALLRENEARTNYTNLDFDGFADNFAGKLTHVLTDVAKMYLIITGLECRACVKIIPSDLADTPNVNIEDLYAIAMARDISSQEANRENDRVRFERQSDRIDKNTDFLTLYDPNKAYRGHFLCNYHSTMMRQQRHQNTSFDFFQMQEVGDDEGEREGYPLPYKSYITWPIKSMGSPTRRQVFVGFLSVDAPSEGVFVARFDAPMGGAIAAALFEPIYRYTELAKRVSVGS